MTDKPTYIAPTNEAGPNPALTAPSIWRQVARDDPDPEDIHAVLKTDLSPDLQFDPVPRRSRHDGFTPKRQRTFIAMLAATGSVKTAAKAIDCSTTCIQALRNAAGAESFSAAWDKATARGARQILDVMIDNAINGTPEYLYQNGQLIAERRRFNTRGQQWIVAHYLPDMFGVSGGLMHVPGSPAQLKRLKQQWRQEWAQEQRAHAVDVEAVKNEIIRKSRLLDRPRMIEFAQDPAKRAAYELINGPTDWSEFE